MKRLLLQGFLPLVILVAGCSKSKEATPVQPPIEIKVIGTQQWMKVNLDVVTYRNGDKIPQVTDPAAWSNLTTGAWCYYNNDPTYGNIYGRLYNWYTVNDPRGLAPKGFHIPTEAECTTLSNFLGGANVAGGKLKSTGTSRWASPNTGATNECGFAALPGGYQKKDGDFLSVGRVACFWIISESSLPGLAYGPFLRRDSARLFTDYWDKREGQSVRCLKDYFL